MFRNTITMFTAIAMGCTTDGDATLSRDALSYDARTWPVAMNDRAALARNGSLAPAADLAELLVAARGAPAMVCALAAEAIGNYGWRYASTGAPRTPQGEFTLRARGIRRGNSALDLDEGSDRRANPFSADDVQLLLESLGSADLCVRDLAVRLIATDRRDATAVALSDRLTASDSTVREVVAFGLGLTSRRITVPALLASLRDRATGVRANAAWALGRTHDGRALDALSDAVGDAQVIVREAAVGALGHLDSSSVIPKLTRVLQQDDAASVRRVAAWALGSLHAESAADALAQVLSRDRDVAVREMSAWALGSLDTHDGGDALLKAVQQDASAAVRETAAWALGEREDEGAAATLGTVMSRETNRAVRGTAAWALGQLSIRVAPPGLVRALEDADAEVRLKASWALSEIRDSSVVPALKTALAKETHVDARRAQIRAIVASGGRSEAILTDLLSSRDPQVREAAVRGLAGRSRMDPWPWPMPRPRPFP